MLIAGDSTKLRAQNSRKSNFNQKKIERHVAYIDNRLNEYYKALAEQDGDNKEVIQQEIQKHLQRKDQYRKLEEHLNQTGETRVSTSDPESRLLMVHRNISEVAYSIQTTTDAKHCLPIDYKVTNSNDNKAMGNMLQRAKSILGTNEFTALYDKGYHTGSELEIAHKLGIETLVAIPEDSAFCQPADPIFSVENFTYSTERDSYTCPQGAELLTNGTWYTKRGLQFKQYKTKACRTCPVKNLCTTAVQNGRMIQRSEFAPYIERNKANMLKKRFLYKRRKAIVEHPYGTIKRQWGFNYILTKKGKERASADVGFMFTAYNLRRLFNIIGQEELIEYLKRVLFSVFYPCRTLWALIAHLYRSDKKYQGNLTKLEYLIT